MLAKALLDCHSNSKKTGKALSLKVFVAGRNRLENDGSKALAEVFKVLNLNFIYYFKFDFNYCLI